MLQKIITDIQGIIHTPCSVWSIEGICLANTGEQDEYLQGKVQMFADSGLEEKCLSNITKNKREITTWFPKDNFYDFMVETNEEDYIEEGNYDWDDNWEYYNDNLDMDQQSPEFWNF